MSDGTIRKQFVADEIKRPQGAGDRVRRFVISTANPDRDNDTISVSGWKLDAYKSNPVVLWAHDYSQLPIARALSVAVENGKLVATAEFADHEFANTVLRLIDGKFLNATSVGFRPLKSTRNGAGGNDFTEQELLEFSVVPVPAQSQALALRALGGEVVLELQDQDDPEHYSYEQIARAFGDVAAAERRRLASIPPGDPAARHRGAVFDVDEGEVRLMVAGAVRQAVRDIAQAAAADAVLRLRGRVD